MNKQITFLFFLLLPLVFSCTQKGQDGVVAKPAEESAYRSVIRLWSVDHLSERIESELMDGFRRYPNACDEVWLLAEGNGGYFAPASDEELEKLKKAADDCRELGIIVSYQDLSLGHPDNIECPPGLNKYGFRAAIGANGKASYTQTCPRDTAFVRAYAQKYAQVCEAIRPDNVMIDDDLRLTLHGPSEIICFCDDCIARFNEEYGHRFNHESLVKALESNQPGIRSEWIEFSQYSLAYFAGQIAEAVHQVSPESHLGLQHVAFHANLMEGWDWNKIFDAMRAATGNTVSSRPGHGVYNDHAPRMIIEKAYGISRQIGRLEGDFHTIFPEIEGFEHRATGKSPQSICTETLLYLSMGANAMSYSLIGGNHEKMDWYADNYFKYLDRYHKLFCDYVAFNKGSEGAGIDDFISPSLVLRDEPGWMNTDAGRTSITLSPLGIPFTPEAKRCTASILDAQNIAGMGSEEIAAFLSANNVILDARGWDKVMERGLQSLFKKVDIPEGLPQDTGCFETQGSKRAVILGKPFRYDISAAQRQELLRAFDWASEGRMSVFPETFSQCVTVPRVDSESGLLRSVTYVNATITDQENITLRLRSCPGKAKFSWEDVKGSHRLKAVRDGDDVLVTIPFIKAWDAGWIRIE